MKKGNIISTAFILLTTIPFIVIAQKLPNVQETSLRAPASIKVDGKATEWKDQFQAYNKATEISYTLSNDDQKLYLTVQATDLNIVNKIICAGITLTINGSGKMKDKDGVAITYPMLQINRSRYLEGLPPVNLDRPESYTPDSFMVALNGEIASRLKDIRITGVKEIPIPLISIYNQEGIKAKVLFDNKSAMTYELAVPLKYLGISINDQKPFAYNIKLPGMNPDMTDGMSYSSAIRVQRREIRNQILTTTKVNGIYIPQDFLVNLIGPTDFWGEYTLAK